MPVFTPSITEDAIFTELRRFLLYILAKYPTLEVVQGQDNRVPEPKGNNFIVMWIVRNIRLSTNVDSWTGDNPETLEMRRSGQVAIQLDIHGPDSANIATIVSAIWRSTYAPSEIDGDVFTPLFANDPRQIPFINGEMQYENRWIVELQMQTNPVISTPQQFADKLNATVIPPADGA